MEIISNDVIELNKGWIIFGYVIGFDWLIGCLGWKSLLSVWVMDKGVVFLDLL